MRVQLGCSAILALVVVGSAVALLGLVALGQLLTAALGFGG